MRITSRQDNQTVDERNTKDRAKLRNLKNILGIALNRLLFGLLVLLTIIYLTHFGLSMAGGESLSTALGEALRKMTITVINILTGNLGNSTAATSDLNPIPIRDVYPVMFARSLGLLGLSLILSAFLGVILGFFTARRKNPSVSMITTLLSIVGVSTPSFFAAFILQRLVIRLTQSTGTRVLPVGGFGWDEHLILPVLVLAARPIAQITRITAGAVSETLNSDYVRTARGKGLTQRLVIWRHAFRNVAIPVATTVGLSLRFSLSSLPVVEAFFGWPGLGYYLLRGISQQDEALTTILVLCLGVLFIGVNIILETLYPLLDPRLLDENGRMDFGGRQNLKQRIENIIDYLRSILMDNPLRRWIRTRDKKSEAVPSFSAALEVFDTNDLPEDDRDPRAGRKLWRHLLQNPPLIFGGLMVLALLIVTFSGDQLAPLSPYQQLGLRIVEGEISVPPFEPGGIYNWGSDVLGRDVMSLILAGAWQTMRLAALVVLARLVVGFVLGAIAGWNSGRLIDRIILGTSETLFAFPPLLLSMIIILAIGVREGFLPFVIALCFVGWGEVMQFVRSEVMAMKPRTFIEGAVAVGQRVPGIIRHHVLPNVLPALISVAALEMGATLMLLGELGFVGLFIGGGAFAELDIGGAPYHYSDVPEWSALLSNVRLYSNTYPWTALYPALAFFVAIVAFNLFGEGIRKFFLEESVRFGRWLNRYTVSLSVVVLVGLGWLRGGTGSLRIYQGQAEEFSGARAYQYVQLLTSPATDDRAIGTVGLTATAEWIAKEFEALGLQPAGEKMTYFMDRTRGFEGLDEVPLLCLEDGGEPLTYREDFVEFPSRNRNRGTAVGRVRLIGFNELTPVSFSRNTILNDMDFSGDILLLLNPHDIYFVEMVPHAGALVVTRDPLALKRGYTLSPREAMSYQFPIGFGATPDRPVLMISEAVADRILSGTGMTVSEAHEAINKLPANEVLEIQSEFEVAIDVQGTVEEKITMRHVMGFIPGRAAFVEGGDPSYQMDNQLIIVMAKYDAPPANPTGEPVPAANDNASGVAVMLEMIRAMRDSGYEPNRSILFVAYVGEGMESGTPVPRPEVAKLLEAKRGFITSMNPEAIIEIRGIGAGETDELLLSGGGSLRLMELFENTALRYGVGTKRFSGDVDLSVIYFTGSPYDSAEEAPRILVGWEGWEEKALTTEDTLANISEEKLKDAGRTISLALMIMGRELQY